MHLHRRAVPTAGAAALALALGSLNAGPAAARTVNGPDAMTRAITTEAVMDHLEAFQEIADANGGNRAAGTPGYEASARYVEGQLRSAGYTTRRQYFDFYYEQVLATSLREVSPSPQDLVSSPMSYSPATPAGGVTGTLAAPAVATGCELADYAGADLTGSVALVQRGGCPFAQKSTVAGQAGAEAVIVYNNREGELDGTLGGVDEAHIPTTGTTQAQGEALLARLAQGPVTVSFVLDKVMETRQTFNVLAETRAGRADNVVMVGAHLDSVEDGPGINDNGSGSAGILETAIQLGKAKKLNNKVRFAWWGAEELGLLGSEHYVDDLVANDPGELQDVATYLNFDMIGSPNYIIGVYDADESTYPAPVEVPAGSTATEDVFTDYLDAIGQPWVDTEFSGRSDYAPFIENGIPSSGLFTGADGTKTEEEQALFGGTAGVLYDPSYHTPEDDIDNVDPEALGIMSDAIGYATVSLALDTRLVNGARSAGRSGKPHPTKDRADAPVEGALAS